jgi:hypothetical protein
MLASLTSAVSFCSVAPLLLLFLAYSYPTLKIFRGNTAEKGTEYQGPREADGIVSYLTKQVGPASAQLATKADVDALLAKEDVVVVRGRVTLACMRACCDAMRPPELAVLLVCVLVC